MPGRNGGEWGEVTSTSNCTDYQARRLNVRFKDEDGKNKYVHMLNGTAIACSRGLIAVIENFQQADGAIRMPAGLDTLLRLRGDQAQVSDEDAVRPIRVLQNARVPASRGMWNRLPPFIADLRHAVQLYVLKR